MAEIVHQPRRICLGRARMFQYDHGVPLSYRTALHSVTGRRVLGARIGHDLERVPERVALNSGKELQLSV
jgi:hypothetical protein